VSQQTPQEGIAQALGDLSEQTHALAREEIDAARQEMWGKAKAVAPAAALAGLAAGCALFAVASVYRWEIRLLEKALPPATAPLVAAVGYTAAAAVAGTAAFRKLRAEPLPLPTRTARATGEAARDVVVDLGG
jgi:uncharacterized protein (DUF1684 family)